MSRVITLLGKKTSPDARVDKLWGYTVPFPETSCRNPVAKSLESQSDRTNSGFFLYTLSVTIMLIGYDITVDLIYIFCRSPARGKEKVV